MQRQIKRETPSLCFSHRYKEEWPRHLLLILVEAGSQGLQVEVRREVVHEILDDAEAVVGRAHGNPEGVDEVVVQLFTPQHHEHGMNVGCAETR